MNNQFIILFSLLLLFSIPHRVMGAHSFYPEEMSGIDYLTNDIEGNKEYFVIAYSSNPLHDDKRNGIQINQMTNNNMFNTCTNARPSATALTFTPTGEGNEEWNIASTDGYYPTKNQCLSNPFVTPAASNHIVSLKMLELDKVTDNNIRVSSKLLTSSNYKVNYYYWIQNRNNAAQTVMNLSCDSTIGTCPRNPSIAIRQRYAINSINQIVIQKSANNYSGITCPSHSLVLSFQSGGIQFGVHLLKITISEVPSNTAYTCADNFDCPPSTYCDTAAAKCIECDKKYAQCRLPAYTCGRFTHQWGKSSPIACEFEYFNINQFNDIRFDMDPIRTSASTMAFWIFLPKRQVSLTSNGVLHFSLSDNFVVSMIYEETTQNYVFYLIPYQNYHKVIGAFIDETKTKDEFKALLTNDYIASWEFSGVVEEKHQNRWIYAKFGVNYMISTSFIQLTHRKNAQTASEEKLFDSTKTISKQFIYTAKTASKTANYLFLKYYRRGDTITLSIKNAKSFIDESEIILHHLYVFASYLRTNSRTGFEYYDLLDIINPANTYPELIFGCDFNKINKRPTSFSISYQTPPQTLKSLDIGIPITESQVFSYPLTLYRLDLLKNANKNRRYNDNDLITTVALTCPGEYAYCFDDRNAYSCTSNNFVDNNYECTTSCPATYLIGKGLNRNRNGMCIQECKNCVSTICTSISCPDGPSNISCNANYNKLLGNCYSSSNSYTLSPNRGALYYSYFFNLPPLYVQFTSISSYYFEFLFLPEPNKHLYPPKEFKGKKVYFMYTNGFALWSDYLMQSFYIDDYRGNASMDFSYLLNMNNWNRITISVKSGDGRLYINNNYNSPFPFIGNPISYLTFCHNDINCVNNSIYWSGGYYKQLRIWNAVKFPYMNDKGMSCNYIYDDIALYDLITANNRMIQWLSYYIDVNLLEGFESISNNVFTNRNNAGIGNYNVMTSTPANSANNIEGVPLYNFGDAQDLYVSSSANKENKYIAQISDYIESTCPSQCRSCYGPGTAFNQNCNTCNLNQYFSNSNCIDIPSTRKTYYVLYTNHPNLRSGFHTLYFSLTKNRITITFWLKIMGMKSNTTSILIEFGNFIFKITNTLILQLSDTNTNRILGSVNISSLFGQYFHVSFAFFRYTSNLVSVNTWRFNLSLQINNKSVSLNTDSPAWIHQNSIINFTRIYQETYAAFANMNTYPWYVIGGYGLDNNKYYRNLGTPITPTMRIIPTQIQCYDTVNLDCVNEYDQMLNDELFPSKKGELFLSDASIGSCDKSCGTTCYNEGSSECSCTNESFDSWIQNNQCKKLDYIDFQRYKNIQIDNVPCTSFPNHERGYDFWMFVARYDISIIYDITMPSVMEMRLTNDSGSIIINYNRINQLSRLTVPTNTWIKVKGYYKGGNLNYSASPGGNSRTPFTGQNCIGTTFISFHHNSEDSMGALFFRQFRIWNREPDPSVSNTEIITKFTFSSSNIIFVIDPFISDITSMTIYSPTSTAGIVITENHKADFGYYSYDGPYSKLTLCLETEECDSILNLNQFDNLEINSIKPSATGRYSIDLWAKTTDALQLQMGINIIWEKHIAISIITDITKKNIDYFCFPQDYRNTPKDKTGSQITKEASMALNVDSFSRSASTQSNQWVYIRCSYSWDIERYYLQDESSPVTLRSVVKENTFPGFNMDYPVKYFLIDFDTTRLYIQNSNKSLNTQTTIRSIHLFTEYIPPNIPLARVLYSAPNQLLDSLSFEINFMGCISNGNTERCPVINNRLSSTVTFTHSSGSPKINGGIRLCLINTQTYDAAKLSCESFNTPPLNARLYNGNTVLECNNNFYLDAQLTPNQCVASPCSNNWTRSPGSSETRSICNYECDLNHVPCTFTTDFSTNLNCNAGFSRVGYKCLPVSSQMQASFYFNRCYNFYPINLAFTPNTKLLTENGYAIEFWFKFDKVNEFCQRDNAKDRYVFWAFPHALYQKQTSDDVYYLNLITSTSSPTPLSRISQFEWNYIIIQYQNNYVNVYINHKLEQPDYSYSTPLNIDYNLQAIAFCTNTARLCSPLGIPLNLEWSSAFYNRLRIYDLRYTNVYTINDYSLSKASIFHKGLIIAYVFNNVNNDLNKIENEANNGSEFLDFNTNIPIGSIYHHKDKILMYASTSAFDWGEFNPGQFVSDVEIRTGVIKSSGPCHINCLRCYSEADDDCYSCKSGFSLFNGECRANTGTYFTIPETLASSIIVNHPSVDFSKLNPITISFWIKFYGIKSTNTETCVLIVKVSDVNRINMCFNMSDSKIILNAYLGVVLFEDSVFITKSGSWQLISFSNYNSIKTTPYYPEMFTMAINGNIIPRAASYVISSPGVTLDTIEFGFNFLGVVTDIRVYGTFIQNPFGIITNDELKNQHLVFEVKLMGGTSIDCFSASDFTPDITALPNICQEDYNLHHDTTIPSCPKTQYLSSIGCKQCHSRCDYCEENSEVNCACYYNSEYLFRRHQSNNQLYCQLLPYYDFASYAKVEFGELNHGDTNEYTIDFWILVYSYDEATVKFTYQTIIWDHHNKINIEYDQLSKTLHINCYPVYYENDTKVSSSYFLLDDSKTVNKWIHVMCATSLTKAKYYLNDIAINDLQGSFPKLRERTDKGSLIFKSDQNDPVSDSVVLIKEVRLWSLFNLREFPFECKYDPALSSIVPFLLHHFPMTHDLKGDVTDSLGNKAAVVIKNSRFIGYNIVDYLNTHQIDQELDHCVVLVPIPSRGYFNSTNHLIVNENNIANIVSNDYYYSISTKGDKLYSQMTLETIQLGTTSNEIMQKYSQERFKDTELNLYVKSHDATANTFNGFTKIDILTYDKNVDIDFSVYAKTLSELKSTYTLDQVSNRIEILTSLTNIHPISYGSTLNQTQSELKDGQIQLNNPKCSDDYCSYQGMCVIVVRTKTCICNKGYSGTNCQMTTSSANFLSPLYTLYWDHISQNRQYDLLTYNQQMLTLFLSLVKGIGTLSNRDSKGNTNEILLEYYNLLNYAKSNHRALLQGNIKELLLAENDALTNVYIDSNQLRAENMIRGYGGLISSDEKKRLEKVSDDIVKSIRDIVQLEILNKAAAFDYTFSSFEIIVNPTSKTIDYNSIFAQRKKEYKTYIDSSQCSDEIFNTGLHSNLYLILINYEYNPKSFNDLYLNTTSFLIDVYYSNPNGVTIPSFVCNEPIQIYFPVNVYDTRRIDFIEHYKSQSTFPDPYNPNDPYIYNPIYVDKTGIVLKKTRQERLIDETFAFDLNCSYYHESNDSFSEIGKMSITSDNFIQCETSHLSQFTVLNNDIPLVYPLNHFFFYLYYPQIFICGENYINLCFFLLCFVFLCFFISLIAVACIDGLNKENRADLLESIKYHTLKEFRFFSSDKELKEEIRKINRFYNEEQIEKDIEEYRKMMFGHTAIYSSKNSFRMPHMKEVGSGKEILQKKMQIYRLQDYTPNPDLGKEHNEYFDEMDDSDYVEKKNDKIEEEEYNDSQLSEVSEVSEKAEKGNRKNKKNMEKSTPTPIPLAIPTSKDKLAMLDFDESNRRTTTNQDMVYSHKEKIKNNNFFTQTDNETRNDDIRTSIIPRGNKVYLVNELDTNKSIKDFYEDLALRNPNWKTFYKKLLLNRHFYLSPFSTPSLFNPRYKRIILLYTFMSFLACYITLFLSLMERTGLHEIAKMFIFPLVALIITHVTHYLIILLYRRSPQGKLRIFNVLKTSGQLRLMLEYKSVIKESCCRTAVGFIVSFVIFVFSFYFSFNYCVVLYPSIFTFTLTFIISLVLDMFIFEPLILLSVALMYKKSRINKSKDKSFRSLFGWINFNNCL